MIPVLYRLRSVDRVSSAQRNVMMTSSARTETRPCSVLREGRRRRWTHLWRCVDHHPLCRCGLRIARPRGRSGWAPTARWRPAA